MSDSKAPEIDPLVLKLQQELSLVVDIKHLNASNIFDAIVHGMQIVATIATKTNEQKKIILLDCFKLMILQAPDLSQETKDNLIWVVDEMGPGIIEGVLIVAKKGSEVFKKASSGCSCFKC